MKHKEIIPSNYLTYDELEELDEEIENFEFEDDYVPSISELEENLIPDLEEAIRIEQTHLNSDKKEYQKELKKKSLETPIFYIKYLMWLQHQISKKDNAEKFKETKSFIQKSLYKYIIIRDEGDEDENDD